MSLQDNRHGEKPMTACVTGASGMIGRRIVQRLLARGCQVRVLTRRNYVNPHVQIFKGGLSDQTNLEQFICGADMVFHCAAELRDVSKMQEVNVVGTERIVKLINQYRVGYFCHLSSAGVVGGTTQEWVDESTPCRPQNAYERTKLEAETIARVPIAGCSTVILRPTNVVDEDHLSELILPVSGSFSSKLKAFVKGGECAHIVHAEDVAEAAIYFSERFASKPRLFFVSLDHDPLNTVAYLWSIYQAMVKGQGENKVTPLPHLPAFIPHILRRIAGKRANSGSVRYSSRQLISEGFKFSFGVSDVVRRIIFDRSRNKAAPDEEIRHAHS